MAMANETATLAAYVAGLKYEDIPPEVIARVKMLTLDFLGSAVRARQESESTPAIMGMLAALGLDVGGGATAFGAAAAAGKLFELTTEQLISAFGVSGSQAAGSLQFLVNGAWNKRFQVGAAAMNGVVAASLARENFRGSVEAVEGKHGLLVGYT